ncbi:MAG: oxidoreductase, partial [Rhodospirillales bacterium]|nr:oxidoreductase [Rhodospirillales bacterium]
MTMPHYPDLAGKVAIVTGSGRPTGLGQAMAKKLAAEGCKLVINDLGAVRGEIAPAHGVGKRKEMEAVAEEIRSDGGQATAFAANILVESEIKSLVDHAVATYGRLDIMVNNAGIGYLFGPLIEITKEHWDAVLGVNLRGCFYGMKYAAKQMIHQGAGGRIISIASQAAKSGFAFAASYTASKHGL